MSAPGSNGMPGGDPNKVVGGPPSSPPGGQMGGRKKTAWMTHVKATMRAHKGMKLMQVLKMAKKTYKKGMRGGFTSSGTQPHPVNGGRRRGSRKTRRSRRGGNDE